MLERMLGRVFKSMGVEDAPPLEPPSTERAAPSLAHDIVVAMLHPTTGKLGQPSIVAQMALLLELTHEGRLEVAGTGKDTRSTVRDPTALGDPELDTALRRIQTVANGERVSRQVGILQSRLGIAQGLVERGEFVDETHKRLGVLTVRRLRATPAAGRDEIVARVRSVLLGESVPDDRTAALIALVNVGLPLTFFVPRQDAKAARRRAEECITRLSEAERTVFSAAQFAMGEGSSDAGGYG